MGTWLMLYTATHRVVGQATPGRRRLSDFLNDRQTGYLELTMAGCQELTTVGAPIQPAETATTVRVQDGQTLTTDGPFIETKEALGGYYLLEADDLDGALEVAARIPAARFGGAIEVRPVVEH